MPARDDRGRRARIPRRLPRVEPCPLSLPQMGWVIPDDKVGHIYLASFYLCFTTITSVGYGDIFPINNSERMVAVRWGSSYRS